MPSLTQHDVLNALKQNLIHAQFRILYIFRMFKGKFEKRSFQNVLKHAVSTFLKILLKCIFQLHTSIEELGIVVRKPVFGVSDQAIPKHTCSATETRYSTREPRRPSLRSSHTRSRICPKDRPPASIHTCTSAWVFTSISFSKKFVIIKHLGLKVQ